MGRYLTVNGETLHKFWFGCQSSSDILEYGCERQVIVGSILFEELEEIIEKVNRFKAEFEKEFKLTYDSFMENTENMENIEKKDLMFKLASRIDLGEKIIKKLEETKDDLYFEAEI